MKQFIKKLLSLIKESVRKNGDYSSTRIVGYIMICVIVIEITYIKLLQLYAINRGVEDIDLSYNIAVLVLLLSHQLTLFGINKHHESKK